MNCRHLPVLLTTLTAAILTVTACGPNPETTPAAPAAPAAGSKVSTLGTLEVTAKLVEVPDGAIFKRDLYDYATILKYEVVEVHRGKVDGPTLLVGHYNPFKSRGEAADARVREIGGNLRQFEGGQFHRMALVQPIDDHFMGGIVNKYFGATNGPIHWALWTDEAPRR